MFTLSRYIIKEHIGPFFFSFFVITLFFLLNLLFRELGRLLSRGLHIFVILEYFMLHMGWIVAITFPMAVLPAVLMAFGRFSSDNEVTAIKASGVSLYRIITPVLFASLLLCGVCIWFIDGVLPNMNHRASLLTRDIGRKRPTLTIEPGVVFDVGNNVTLLVRRIKESEGYSKVWGVLIDDYSKAHITQTIIADSGEIRFDRSYNLMVIDLHHGEVQKIDYEKLPDMMRLLFPHLRISHAVPGMTLTRSESEHRSDREMSAKMMREEVRNNTATLETQVRRVQGLLNPELRAKVAPLFEKDQITEWRPETVEEILKRAAGSGDTAGDTLALSQLERRNLSSIRSTLSSITMLKKSNSRYMVEVHKKYSIPASCIVFVLIGAPLGILARRGGMAVGGGMSLFFFLLYWAFLIGGEELADRLIITPFWAMWSANILVGAVGLYLVVQRARDTSILDLGAFAAMLKRSSGGESRHDATIRYQRKGTDR